MADDSTTATAANSKDESIKEKEERLRQKLKRKPEDPSVKEKEERLLREKLKKRAEDRKTRKGSETAESDKKPSSATANDAEPKSEPLGIPDGDGQERSKKSKPRRRRRERRQEPRTSGPGPSIDSYGRRDQPSNRDEPYRGGGRGPERGGYRDNGRPHVDHGRSDYGRGGGGGYGGDRDRFGRGNYRGGDSRPVGRGRTRSRSFSRSRSRSSDGSYSSYSSRSSSRSYSRSSSRSRSRSSDDDSRRSRSVSRSQSRSASRSHSKKRQRRSSSVDRPRDAKQMEEDELTKDQRTVFLSQLVMKANDTDIRRYFRKKLGFKVNDVILLRDKRTGRHKGCAYVELSRLEDVTRSLEASGKVPDFQRFPILVKASEAEKNAPVADADKRVEAQKVYVGNIDQNVTQSQLYAIFSQFGQLDRVVLQVDTATGMSKGFAFLSYHDPKVSNLSIATMSGQILAAKAM